MGEILVGEFYGELLELCSIPFKGEFYGELLELCLILFKVQV